MKKFRMHLHRRTRILHYCCKIAAKYFASVLTCISWFLLILRGGFPMRFSHISSIVLSSILSFILYMGDLWPCFQGPHLSKLGFKGGVRIYNPPLTKLSIRLFYPNLGVLFNYLGPLGLMGPHVPLGLWAILVRFLWDLICSVCIINSYSLHQ